MKRKHRHELKQDDLLVWIDRTLTWFTKNRRPLVTVAAVVGGAALLTIAVVWYRDQEGREAQVLLADAVNHYRGQIISEDSAVGGTESSAVFASAEERYAKALEGFENVMNQYSRTTAGRRARYYAGLCLIGLGRSAEAIDRLEQVRRGTRDLIYYLSSRALAQARAHNGDSSEAIDLYRQLIADPNNPLPKDYALYELAQIQEGAQRLEEAQQTYQQLLDEYPDSQLRTDVRQRSEFLEYRLST